MIIPPPEGWWAKDAKRKLLWYLHMTSAVRDAYAEEKHIRNHARVIQAALDMVLDAVDWDRVFAILQAIPVVQKSAVVKQSPAEDELDKALAESVAARVRVLEAAVQQTEIDAAKYQAHYHRVRFDRNLIDPIIARTGTRVTWMSETEKEELRQLMLKAWHEGGGAYGSSKSFRSLIRKRWPHLTQLRAQMIAQTEWRWASEKAKHEIFRQQGNQGVIWLNVGDKLVCPICKKNSARGPVPIPASQDDIGSFSAAWRNEKVIPHPPAHPRCRCNTAAVYRLPPGAVPEVPPEAPPEVPPEEVVPDGWTKEEWAAFNDAYKRIMAGAAPNETEWELAYSQLMQECVKYLESTGAQVTSTLRGLHDWPTTGVTCAYVYAVRGDAALRAFLMSIPPNERNHWVLSAHRLISNLIDGHQIDNLKTVCKWMKELSDRLLPTDVFDGYTTSPRSLPLACRLFAQEDSAVIGQPIPGYRLHIKAKREHVHLYGYIQDCVFAPTPEQMHEVNWERLGPVSESFLPADLIRPQVALRYGSEVRVWDNKRVAVIEWRDIVDKAMDPSDPDVREVTRHREDLSVQFKKLVQRKVARRWAELARRSTTSYTVDKIYRIYTDQFIMPGSYEESCFHTTQYLIKQWAFTSMEDPRSRLLQYAAAVEFDFEPWFPGGPITRETLLQEFRSRWPHIVTDDATFDEIVIAVRHFLRAQWLETQELLQKITDAPYIMLCRGMSRMPEALIPGETPSIEFMNYQPMSSFTVKPDTAVAFAGGQHAIVTVTGVHRSHILSTFATGFGCTSEGEFVVLTPKQKRLVWASKPIAPMSHRRLSSVAGVLKQSHEQLYEPEWTAAKTELFAHAERWRLGHAHPTVDDVGRYGELLLEEVGIEPLDAAVHMEMLEQAMDRVRRTEHFESVDWLMQEIARVRQQYKIDDWRKRLLRVLKQYREMGFKPAAKTVPAELKEAVKAAGQWVPASWAERILEGQPLKFKLHAESRGFYSESDHTIYCAPDVWVVLHEMMHAVESKSHRLQMLLRKFKQQRDQLGTRVPLMQFDQGYSGSEETIDDKVWPHPYYGKVYTGGVFTEILSMGVQDIVTGLSNKYFLDGELVSFIIGLLGGTR